MDYFQTRRGRFHPIVAPNLFSYARVVGSRFQEFTWMTHLHRCWLQTGEEKKMNTEFCICFGLIPVHSLASVYHNIFLGGCGWLNMSERGSGSHSQASQSRNPTSRPGLPRADNCRRLSHGKQKESHTCREEAIGMCQALPLKRPLPFPRIKNRQPNITFTHAHLFLNPRN